MSVHNFQTVSGCEGDGDAKMFREAVHALPCCC